MSIRNKAGDLTEAAIVERAKSMASEWMWAVSLQHDRLVNPRDEDKTFHPWGGGFFSEADLHFLVTALGRLRQAAATIEHAPTYRDAIRPAIEKFDSKLPWRKQLRDVFEHLEDYAVDSDGRKTTTSRRELQVWSATGNGLHFLGFNVDWNEARETAMDLYTVVMRIARQQ
jgi:hypothetical protein